MGLRNPSCMVLAWLFLSFARIYHKYSYSTSLLSALCNCVLVCLLQITTVRLTFKAVWQPPAGRFGFKIILLSGLISTILVCIFNFNSFLSLCLVLSLFPSIGSTVSLFHLVLLLCWGYTFYSHSCDGYLKCVMHILSFTNSGQFSG